MSEEQHSTSLLYFMPDWLFESEDLTLREKMVYSLLTGLAHGKTSKECFPTDAYIGKRLKITPTHANECLKALEKFGAISRRTVRDEVNPFKTKRYIKVHLTPQKSFTNTENSESRGFENSEDAISENSEDSNKEDSIYREREACGAFVKLSKEEKATAIAKYGQEVFDDLVKSINSYCKMHGKKYEDYVEALQLYFERRKKKVKNTKETSVEKAKEWAQGIKSKNPDTREFEILPHAVRFMGRGNVGDIYIDYKDLSFYNRVSHEFRKRGWKIE